MSDLNKPTNNHTVSRRHFLGMAGGLASTAALAALVRSEGWADNKVSFKPGDIGYQSHETDVLVIGGGMAALFAAVKAHDAGARVLMVSKGRLGASGQTPFAKGIFAFDAKTAKVSIDEFTAMVSRSSLGSSNPVYTRQMAEHSQARVKELRDWGFFDSALYNASFSKPIKERKIPLHERVMITHLVRENGRICGAAGFSLDDSSILTIHAKSVILCTGAGGFKPNGFPISDLTHDGSIMAYQIGAKITGKEWNDGHVAQASNAAASFDGWHGMFERKPDVTGVEVHHDLGVNLNYIAYMQGGPLRMGPPDSMMSAIQGGPYVPEEFQRRESSERRGPPGGEKGGERPSGPPPDRAAGGKRPPGPPPGGRDGPPGMQGCVTGGSSAGLSIHKSEGIAPINDQCESTVPGLFAAGDALGSHMSGGIYTQIGSSLAGSAVQGGVAGEAAARYSKTVSLPMISGAKKEQLEKEILAPLRREAGLSPAWVTQTLQGIMIPNFVLYIKKESMLRAALAYVEELRDHHLPLLRAADLHELRLAHETVNMVISAEMKLRASLMRTESRGSHYRLDYPHMDQQNWQAWINIYLGSDGQMKLEKQPFGTWAT